MNRGYRLTRYRPFVSSSISALFMVLVLVGCPDRAPGTSEERASGAPQEEQAPPRIEVPYDGLLRLVTLMAELDGATTPLHADDVLEIADGATLYLETWQRLEDYRVRLVGGNDRLIPFTLESGPVALRAQSFGEPEPGGTWIRVKPSITLVDGRIYQLKIEPELADRVTDHEGRSYEDLVLDLRRLDTSEPEGLDEESASETTD